MGIGNFLMSLYGLLMLLGALKSILECDVGVGEGDSLKLISLQVVIQHKKESEIKIRDILISKVGSVAIRDAFRNHQQDC